MEVTTLTILLSELTGASSDGFNRQIASVFVRNEGLQLKTGLAAVSASNETNFWLISDNQESGFRMYFTQTDWTSETEKEIANLTGSGFLTNVISPSSLGSELTSIAVRVVADGVEYNITSNRNLATAGNQVRLVLGATQPSRSATSVSDGVGSNSGNDAGFTSTSFRSLMAPDTVAGHFPLSCIPYKSSLQVYITLVGSTMPTSSDLARNAGILVSNSGVLSI